MDLALFAEKHQLGPAAFFSGIPGSVGGALTMNAGSFGYESEHIDVAVQMGEDRLFPAVRSARSNVEVATTGISCREQIGFNTPKTSRHIVEILADALPD